MTLKLKIHKLSELQRKILKTLSKQPVKDQKELATVTGSKQPSISRSLKTLITDNLVKKNDRNEYTPNKILQTETIDYDKITYQELIRKIQTITVIDTWEKLEKIGRETSRALKSTNLRKTLADLSIREATLLKKSDVSKHFTEIAQATKRIKETLNLKLMIDVRNEFLSQATTTEKMMKNLTAGFNRTFTQIERIKKHQKNMNAVIEATKIVQPIMTQRLNVLLGIENNLFINNQKLLRTIADSVTNDLINYHKRITKSFELHNMIFPEPYNPGLITKYEEKNYLISTDYIYRASVPLRHLIQPQETVEIQLPPKSIYKEKVKEIIPILEGIDTSLPKTIQGAIKTFERKDHDYLRQATTSLRSVIKTILKKKAPTNKVYIHYQIKKDDVTIKHQIEYMINPGIDQYEKSFLIENTNILESSVYIFGKVIHREEQTTKPPNVDISETAVTMTLDYLIILIKNIK